MLPVVQAQVLTLKGGIGSWINLEDSYMKTTKLSVLSDNDDEITVYNEDLSPHKTINISNFMPGGRICEINSMKLGDKRFNLTQTLFNEDDLIEFIVSGEGFFAIINENNVELFRENVSGDVSECNLFETTSYTYIQIPTYYYSEEDGYIEESKLYLINKGASSNIPALTQVKSFSHPNPARETINIAYNLQGAETGTVVINSLSGKLIDRQTVKGDAASFNYSTRRLASGTYVVSVEANGKQLSSEKIIVVKGK
jgi:hypothetical protein